MLWTIDTGERENNTRMVGAVVKLLSVDYHWIDLIRLFIYILVIHTEVNRLALNRINVYILIIP